MNSFVISIFLSQAKHLDLYSDSASEVLALGGVLLGAYKLESRPSVFCPDLL